MRVGRYLFGSAALVALLAAGVAAPGFAQDEKAAKAEKAEKIERVILIEDSKGEAAGKDGKRRFVIHRMDGAEGKEGKARHVRMHRMAAAKHARLAHCEGEKTQIEESSDKERTKIVLCHAGMGDKLSAEERAKKLEETRARLAKNNELSAEHKARMEAALQQAIERLRATN